MANDLGDLLRALQDASDQMDDGDNELYITCIKEAEDMVDRRLAFGKTMEVDRIVDYITNPGNRVTGSTDQFHNLITSFQRFGHYNAALQICDYALRTYPYSVDLLANAIQAAGQSGQFNKGQAYLDAANEIDKKCWNWRLYVFALDFYQEYLSTCPRSEVDDVLNAAMALAKDFQTYLPMDERGYNKEAELHLFSNDLEAARKTLTKAIFKAHGSNDDGDPIYLVASQCCVTYLNKILDDTREYNEIIKVANAGIQFTTQEQPSARIGYFVYRKALAMDAKCVADNYRVEPDIIATLRQYQCAYPLNQGMSYTKTIESRFKILCQNPVHPIPNMVLAEKESDRPEKKIEVEED